MFGKVRLCWTEDGGIALQTLTLCRWKSPLNNHYSEQSLLHDETVGSSDMKAEPL